MVELTVKVTHYIDPLTGERRPLEVHPLERKAAQDYASLTEPERVWYTTTRLIFCIRDGGLISYYYNGYAEHVQDLVRSLDTLGAVQAKALVLEVNALFGAEVPKTLDALNAAIESWADAPEIWSVTDRDDDSELDAATDAEQRLNAYALQHGIEP